MKTATKTLTIAGAAILFSALSLNAMIQINSPATPARDTLRVKVTGIKTAGGNIMVSAGDYTRPLEMAGAMVPASGETVECVLVGDVAPGTNLYAFHDENGNFNLDLTEKKLPAEGCYYGKIEPSEEGALTVELTYYTQAENREK
jgi:uncharacterized protein (DUF2141 family)